MTNKPTLDEHFGETPPGERACGCCGAEGVALKVYGHADSTRYPNKFKALCELCSGSYLGVMNDWPTQYGNETMQIGRLIAYVGNEILKELRRPREGT